jgi:hypothetical protein
VIFTPMFVSVNLPLFLVPEGVQVWVGEGGKNLRPISVLTLCVRW